MDFQTDRLIRSAALQWLAEARFLNPYGEIYYRDADFEVPELGRRLRAISPQAGIWKPRELQACLSLMSSVRHAYDDSAGDDVLHYKYRAGGGYHHSDNRSLRLAMEHRLPVLYFRGVAVGIYQVDPVLVVHEMPDRGGVAMRVLSDEVQLPVDYIQPAIAEPDDASMRYRTYVAQRRLHQSEFRQRIMRAYRTQCAVCHFKRESLLDAAHIIPDAQGGRPDTSNGLSLCRIHHSAYDRNILGIDPDYRIHISRSMLEERDGPMLKHGFQEMDRQLIIQPRRSQDRPDQDKLSQRYERFRKAA